MHSYILPVTLLASLTSALSIPSSQPTKFTLESRGDKSSSTLRKRNIGATDSTAATFIGSDWTIPVSIGGQTLDVTFDTGSTDLWVQSTLEPKKEQKSKDGIFNPKKSTTYAVSAGQSMIDSYTGGFSVLSEVGSDNVQVGSLVAKKMEFGAVKSIDTTWSTAGIMGFAFQGLSRMTPNPQPSFFESIMSLLEQPTFATKFTNSTGSTVDFGFVNPKSYTGNLTTVGVNAGEHTNFADSWSVPSMTFAVAGSKNPDNTELEVIFDTGASQTLLPDDTVTDYYSSVKGAVRPSGDNGWALWRFPCSSTLPDLTMTFHSIDGANTVTVPGYLFNGGKVGKNTCQGLVLTSPSVGYYSIGDAFFLHNYVVFNHQTPSISFAPQA